jgi:ribonuclease R
MFMVEANEAAARALDAIGVPFLRRTHPEPEMGDSERLRSFVQVAGYRVPKTMDRKEIQAILTSAKGKPEEYALNLAVLKSLTRAEYSPEAIGHFALASEYYCHYTSPIRRYADLTVHRLLDRLIEAQGRTGRLSDQSKGRRKVKVRIDDAASFDNLVELGRHLSFTERRAEDAERELRQVKILELLKDRLGHEFQGVVTGIANFGIFVQLSDYQIDGVIRYEDLMDDWWDVDIPAGMVRGQRTGKRIGIGDPCKVIIARVDPPRRELELAITQITGRARGAAHVEEQGKPKKKHEHRGKFGKPTHKHPQRGKKFSRRRR